MSKRQQIQDDALQIAVNNPRCTLGISMGVGKTLIGLRYLQKLYLDGKIKKKILVVAPKKSIFTTWKDEAVKHGIFKDVMDNVEYVTYISLNKKNPNDYSVVIFDEVHNILNTHLSFLGFYTGRILGLTGTPPRYPNSEKGKIIGKACPVLFKYITDDAVEDEILNDYRIIVHNLSLSFDKTIKVQTKNGGSFYKSEVDDYNYWTTKLDEAVGKKNKQIASVMRMKSLMTAPTKERYAKKLALHIDDKCLIFCNTQEQADNMCTHSIHSSNSNSEDNLDKFKKGDIQQASCVLQINEGVNIPDLRACIILHAYGNERKASQRIGRALRLNPTDTATIHILCYKNTVDEIWVKEALKDFDQNKIKYFNL
jgi:superfamily II DNA or RNA helicase